MLGDNIRRHDVNVWLVNTGWTGGSYGTGQRIKLAYTRALIRAALTGGYADVCFVEHPVFGVSMPAACPGVPVSLLDPRQTWADPDAYDAKAEQLRTLFADKRQSFAKRTADVQ